MKGVVPEMHEANGMRAFGYLAYWHAGLHVVIEGWAKLRLSDAKIDVLVASPNVDLLRRFRNGAFHYQRDLFDDRFTDFMKSVNLEWVRSLSAELDRWFRAFPYPTKDAEPDRGGDQP